MKLSTIYLKFRDRVRAHLMRRYQRRMRKWLTVEQPHNTSFPKLGDSRSSQEWHKNVIGPQSFR